MTDQEILFMIKETPENDIEEAIADTFNVKQLYIPALKT